MIYETFTVRQAAIGRPANPDHLLEENELLEMFRDFFCIRYHEGLTEEGTEMAGIISRKAAS